MVCLFSSDAGVGGVRAVVGAHPCSLVMGKEGNHRHGGGVWAPGVWAGAYPA